MFRRLHQEGLDLTVKQQEPESFMEGTKDIVTISGKPEQVCNVSEGAFQVAEWQRIINGF